MACELLSRRGGRLLLGRNQRAERLALSGDPVDQACGIQQRCRERLQAPSHESRTGAGIGCAPYSRGPIKPAKGCWLRHR
jgi:hypothetical protein